MEEGEVAQLKIEERRLRDSLAVMRTSERQLREKCDAKVKGDVLQTMHKAVCCNA